MPFVFELMPKHRHLTNDRNFAITWDRAKRLGHGSEGMIFEAEGVTAVSFM